MTPSPVPLPALSSDLATRTRLGGALLAGLTAGFWWAGWQLGLVPHATANAIIGTGPIAAMILTVIALRDDVFVICAAFLLALFPIAALAGYLIFVSSEDLARFTPHLVWPLILAAFAASLGSLLLARGAIMPLFAQAGTLVIGMLMLAIVLDQSQLISRWVLNTPIHTAIWLCAALIICAFLSAGRDSQANPQIGRFIAGMIQLLPLLGFSGTILGIMQALRAMPDIFGAQQGPDIDALGTMLTALSTAFETTLLGVGTAIILSFIALITTNE